MIATLSGSPLDSLDYTIIAIYMAAMVALGAVLTTRNRVFKDYFLASGALTTPLLVCSLVSSYYGIDVTFGTSEAGYYYGVVAWFWYSLPYYVFIAIAALVIAPRLRKYGGAMTLPDILEHHYGVRTRVVGAVACFVYSAPMIAIAGIIAVLESMGVPRVWGLVGSIGICAAYTAMGGLWADAMSDTVQFVLMCVSLAITIPLAVNWVGGWGFLESLPVDPASGARPHLLHHGGMSPWMLAAWSLTGVTLLVEPAFYQRVFAASDGKSVQRALMIGILLWASYDWGAALLGLIGKAAAEQGLIAADLPGKQVLLTVCMEMLPTGMRGLMIGGILAAAMSQIDSYALLGSGNLVYDIYRPMFDPQASDRRLLLMTRIGVFIVMFASAVMSLAFVRMRDAWQFMASVMAAVVLVPVLGALFGRPRKLAGFFGAAGGLIGVCTFYALLYKFGRQEEDTLVWRGAGFEIWQDYAVLCSVPISLATFMLGNLLGERKA